MKLLQYFCYAYNSKLRITQVSKSKSYIFVLGNETDIDEAICLII